MLLKFVNLFGATAIIFKTLMSTLKECSRKKITTLKECRREKLYNMHERCPPPINDGDRTQ